MATTQYSYADLHASRGPLIISIHVLFSTLATVAVALRIYTRTILIPGTHGLEDWLLTATWVCDTQAFIYLHIIYSGSQ